MKINEIVWSYEFKVGIPSRILYLNTILNTVLRYELIREPY